MREQASVRGLGHEDGYEQRQGQGQRQGQEQSPKEQSLGLKVEEAQRLNRLQVHNVGSYTFECTGQSSVADAMGMRQMQGRAFAKRDAQYLLIQAPPACGKSRALMFLALDKVINQGIDKVIIAVPQIAIGASFRDTELSKFGFFADWHVDPQYNLCSPGGEAQKVAQAQAFLNDPEAHYLLCSHATLVYFYEKIKDRSLFDNSLVAIDEFHHVSQDEGNKLGNVIHSLMTTTQAHIIAMTGSYFRGDAIPVLSEEDEAKFERVIYTYYEQLNGYKYLKSLGIDYAFYEGSWIHAVELLLDLDKKTIIHIPSVNSRESTHDKINEVSYLIDYMGTIISTETDTGIMTIKAKNGKLLKVADLVSNVKAGAQSNTLAALRNPEVLDTIDIIIALGMAKEGFDWPQCEYALTVGYRSSLTEVVQIIGRATRDYPGKFHTQFTNLLAMPYGQLVDIQDAVNSLLKAITLSLLMEQVLAPNVHFRARPANHDVGNSDAQEPESTNATGSGDRSNDGSDVGSGNGSGDTSDDADSLSTTNSSGTSKGKGTGQDESGKGSSDNNGTGTDQDDDVEPINSISITVNDEEISQKGIEFLNTNYQSIVEKVLNSSDTVKAAIANGGNETTKTLVADDVYEIIRKLQPDFSDEEQLALALAIVKAMVVKSCTHNATFAKNGNETTGDSTSDASGEGAGTASGTGTGDSSSDGDDASSSKDNGSGEGDLAGGARGTDGSGTGDGKGTGGTCKPDVIIIREKDTTFLKIKDKLVNIDDIDFNMIGSINPFAHAYQFVSKALNPTILKQMQNELNEKRQHMTEEIALTLWPRINQFVDEHNGIFPSPFASSDYERHLAAAFNYLKRRARQKNSAKAST